jgi:hypothetical protein
MRARRQLRLGLEKLIRKLVSASWQQTAIGVYIVVRHTPTRAELERVKQ